MDYMAQYDPYKANESAQSTSAQYDPWKVNPSDRSTSERVEEKYVLQTFPITLNNYCSLTEKYKLQQ